MLDEEVVSHLQDKILQMLALLFVYIFTLVQTYKDLKGEYTIVKIAIIIPFVYMINEIQCLEDTRKVALKKSKVRESIDFIERLIFGSVKKRRLMGHSLAIISSFSFFLLLYLISNPNINFVLFNFYIPEVVVLIIVWAASYIVIRLIASRIVIKKKRKK